VNVGLLSCMRTVVLPSTTEQTQLCALFSSSNCSFVNEGSFNRNKEDSLSIAADPNENFAVYSVVFPHFDLKTSTVKH